MITYPGKDIILLRIAYTGFDYISLYILYIPLQGYILVTFHCSRIRKTRVCSRNFMLMEASLSYSFLTEPEMFCILSTHAHTCANLDTHTGEVRRLLAIARWFPPGAPVSSTSETDILSSS